VPGDAIQINTSPSGLTEVIANELDGLVKMLSPTEIKIDPGRYKLDWDVSGVVPPSITVPTGATLSNVKSISGATDSFYTTIITATTGVVANVVA